MIHWLILTGAAEAGFLSFFLLQTDRGNQSANKILSAYLVIVGCYLVVPELIRSKAAEFPHLLATLFPPLLVIGPAIFFYFVSVVSQKIKKPREILMHLLPACACLIYLFPFFVLSGPEKIHEFQLMRENGPSFYFAFLWALVCIHIIGYHLFTFIKVRNYNRGLEDLFSKIENIRLEWLQRLAWGMLLIWSFYLLSYAIVLSGIEIDPWGISDQIFALCLTTFIFYLSFKAMNNPEIFPAPSLGPIYTRATNQNKLSDTRRSECLRRLELCMNNDKAYLNPTITLGELSKMIDISPRIVSQVINEEFRQTFFDFINYQRVQEVKRKLKDPTLHHFTIVAIALDSGFNSKSTFNEVFKKFERKTPSAYKRSLEK